MITSRKLNTEAVKYDWLLLGSPGAESEEVGNIILFFCSALAFFGGKHLKEGMCPDF